MGKKVCVNIPKVPVNELPVSLVTKYVFLVFLCVGGYIPVCVTMDVSRTFQGKMLCFFSLYVRFNMKKYLNF